MPELPEVETVKNIIKPLVINKTIKNVDIFFDKLILSDLNEFKNKIKDIKIIDIFRYGKFLFFKLDKNLILIIHLRMEGKFRYLSPEFKNQARGKHTTLIFNFNDNSTLSFDDTRKFAIMYLSNENEYKNLEMIKKLGYEPFNLTPKDKEIIYDKFNKKRKLKDLLLDQTILCGIGNIYADEIAYASNLSPYILGSDLTKIDIDNIILNAEKILKKAINFGGSTIHSFHPSEGVDGRMQNELNIYGRFNQKCKKCNTYFHKDFINGRGTTYCPNCQINPYIKKAIGITGPIGSGKSILLSCLKENNFKVASADEIIHNLYKDDKIKKKISSILKIEFDINNKEITNKARKILINNTDKKEEIERVIYPILEKELIKLIEENNDIIIEVPLLFHAHFEYMFKKIIVIEVSNIKQIENLKARNENFDVAKKFNNNFYYDKNNKDVIVIKNNKTKEDFLKNSLDIINKLV